MQAAAGICRPEQDGPGFVAVDLYRTVPMAVNIFMDLSDRTVNLQAIRRAVWPLRNTGHGVNPNKR
jgi:hypothetical protein